MLDDTGPLSQAKQLLATANRLLDNEGVLDAFGHISMRHPERTDRFLLSVAKAPALVTPDDIVEFDMGGNAVSDTTEPLYSERVIHCGVYRRRADVKAVCHHHAPAIMPFCIIDTPLVPINQLGGAMGSQVGIWDSQDMFGDTNLLVTREEEAASLAEALGERWTVLMKRHGALVVGRNLKELVFRAVHGCDNARALAAAHMMGRVTPLTRGEARMTSELRDRPIERCWDYWIDRLQRAGRGV